MSKNKNYFTKGQYLFWVLILLFLSFAFFHQADKMFTEEGIVDLITDGERPPIIDTTSYIATDTTSEKNEDLIPFTWKWKDYKGIGRSITFKLSKRDLIKSTNNRKNLNPEYSMDPWSAFPAVYSSMYNNDKKCLKSIVEAYKNEIKSAGISNYQESLDFVVSSIQALGYTFICSGYQDRCGINGNPAEDCRPPKKGFFSYDLGCCDNIIPLAVYSPFEFAFQQTGDCDTKALFAYTILKEMGYKDVAVLIGNADGGGHSMLGVKVPNPPYNKLFITHHDGSKYYAWEVTQGDNKLGQNCWSTWDDWRVSIN
jgi:hypothetical protein